MRLFGRGQSIERTVTSFPELHEYICNEDTLRGSMALEDARYDGIFTAVAEWPDKDTMVIYGQFIPEGSAEPYALELDDYVLGAIRVASRHQVKTEIVGLTKAR